MCVYFKVSLVVEGWLKEDEINERERERECWSIREIYVEDLN